VDSPDDGTSGLQFYDVGVAILPLRDGTVDRRADRPVAESPGGQIPGYDEVLGRKEFRSADHRSPLIERGEDAVRAATEGIAAQIALAAQRIAEAIDARIAESSNPTTSSLESVGISFGITLISGIQAVFTAQAESSVQVSITLKRHPSPVPTKPEHSGRGG
jgi:hypothetical protein